MHHAHVAHLVVKPSNVIVSERTGRAVIVDFGLAGRSLRPGCGSPAYGAPEVWQHHDGEPPLPFAADVYVFGCLAFEVLAGHALFRSDELLTQVMLHMTHDSLLPLLVEMMSRPRLSDVGVWISRMLEPEWAARPTMKDVRRDLQRMRPALAELSWPLLADMSWESADFLPTRAAIEVVEIDVV